MSYLSLVLPPPLHFMQPTRLQVLPSSHRPCCHSTTPKRFEFQSTSVRQHCRDGCALGLALASELLICLPALPRLDIPLARALFSPSNFSVMDCAALHRNSPLTGCRPSRAPVQIYQMEDVPQAGYDPRISTQRCNSLHVPTPHRYGQASVSEDNNKHKLVH